SSTGPCLDIENLLDPELKKRLGEPLERPLRAARPQSPHEAQLMSELYARIAQKCGKPLLDEVAGPNSHERFDASLENATRVFDAIVTEELAQQDATLSKDVQPIPWRFYHSLLSMRWCAFPLLTLAYSGSLLVACQLCGHFGTWSAAVLAADCSRSRARAVEAAVLLGLALLLSGLLIACAPLLGLEACGVMLKFSDETLQLLAAYTALLGLGAVVGHFLHVGLGKAAREDTRSGWRLGVGSRSFSKAQATHAFWALYQPQAMALVYQLHSDWPYNILRLWKQPERVGTPRVLQTYLAQPEALRFLVNSNFASKDFHEVRAIWQGGQKEEVCLYVIKDYEGHPTLEAGFAASETDEADGWCCLPLLKGIGETEGYQSGQALSLSELQSLCASDLTRVAAFLRSDACKSVYVLTGAGVSTGAGIPDFRSAGGLYDSIRPELITASFIQRQKMRFDPTYVVERDMFFQNPFPYLEVRRPFILGTHRQQWKATISHWFMKFLEEEGKLKRLFTQNIDGLDYQTGISPTRVTNVHGSIARVSCEGCGKEMPFDDFCAQVRTNIKDIYKTDPEAPEESTSIPCPHCQHPLVKPNTILFGSNLPEEFFGRKSRRYSQMQPVTVRT
ncbi:SIRT3, partial [Symbiodinium necroappetens]